MTWRGKFSNLANMITFSRIVLTGLFLFFVFTETLLSRIMALLLFTLACFTDFLDGYIARKRNQITDFGKLFDPIADKILIFSVFFSFLQMGLIRAWMVIIIFSREIMITAFRLFALSKKKIIQAEKAGKHKLVSQIVAIYLILFFLLSKDILKIFLKENLLIEKVFYLSIQIAMIITVIFTIISGASYIWRNRDLIEL